MRVKLLQLNAEGAIHGKALVEPQRTFYISRPAIRCPLEPQIAVVAALQRHVFHPGITYMGDVPVIELGMMADTIRDGDRRVEGDTIARNCFDLLDFVGRP